MTVCILYTPNLRHIWEEFSLILSWKQGSVGIAHLLDLLAGLTRSAKPEAFQILCEGRVALFSLVTESPHLSDGYLTRQDSLSGTTELITDCLNGCLILFDLLTRSPVLAASSFGICWWFRGCSLRSFWVRLAAVWFGGDVTLLSICLIRTINDEPGASPCLICWNHKATSVSDWPGYKIVRRPVRSAETDLCQIGPVYKRNALPCRTCWVRTMSDIRLGWPQGEPLTLFNQLSSELQISFIFWVSDLLKYLPHNL
jgi:hypothetical protein